jgi:hypothetical protein
MDKEKVEAELTKRDFLKFLRYGALHTFSRTPLCFPKNTHGQIVKKGFYQDKLSPYFTSLDGEKFNVNSVPISAGYQREKGDFAESVRIEMDITIPLSMGILVQSI